MDGKVVFLLFVSVLLLINTTSKAAKLNMSQHRRKAIKNTYNDVYDCVRRYKQPAFDSVKFGNHKIKAKPGKEVYKAIGLNPSNERQLDPHDFGFEEWCPLGYVPIRRIAYHPKNANHSLLQSDTQYAGIKTKFSDTKEYHGADGYMAIYQPELFGQHGYSSSIISMIGGESENTRIVAGWTVYPDLNSDAKTRILIGWTNDNFQSIGCYNLHCSGFVLVGNANPIGSVITPISAPDSPVDKRFTIIEDPTDWKWWLFIDSSPVGYWPHWLFTASLQNGANKIFWGGVVYTPPDEFDSQMGSGRVEGDEKSCYMRNVWFSDSQSKWQSPDKTSLDVLQSDCYLTIDASNKNNIDRYSFYFGGRGRCP